MRLRAIVIAFLLVLLPLGAAFANTTTTDDATTVAQDDDFTIGLILVGPQDDRGWSQAHYEAAEYVLENVEGTNLIVSESINPADNPDRTLDLVVEDMVDQGADLIIANSDEYKNDVNAVAPFYPDVTFIHISGDAVLTGDAPENVTNLMAQMVYGKAMAGCSAALTTETGKISYLGPLINDETRRLASSAFLGAQYCYENFRGMDAADLEFEVVWIGFWFNIPGVTLDPTEVANSFFDGGSDVIISGIDTTEAIVVAGQRAREGEPVTAVPYDFEGGCEEAPEVCLGVPYFNWGPDYVSIVEALIDGSFEPTWTWSAPVWEDLNNKDVSPIGFLKGEGLSEEAAGQLDEFIAWLAENQIGDEGSGFWAGPIVLQDGTEYIAEGANATLEEVWYLPQLLEGMVGDSGE